MLSKHMYKYNYYVWKLYMYLHFESTRVGSVAKVMMVQIQRFSESLEGALSDGMLKSQIWNGP